MTHIVIPTAREPRNHCLPFALASIAQHTDYTPVTVGFNPRSKVAHLDSPQTANRFANTDRAVRLACTTEWISDPFILSADDIYWLRPAQPTRWALGTLNNTDDSSEYSRRKAHTAHRLQSLGLPVWDYESHTPLLIWKQPMLKALDLGGDKRSMYGNLTGQPDVIAPDVKMRDRTAPLPDAPWVSTAFKPTQYPALANLLPTPPA